MYRDEERPAPGKWHIVAAKSEKTALRDQCTQYVVQKPGSLQPVTRRPIRAVKSLEGHSINSHFHAAQSLVRRNQ